MRQPSEIYLIQQAEKIGYEALSEVTNRYGIGIEEHDIELPPEVIPLAYHNGSHTSRVRAATKLIAAQHGLSSYDAALAQLAASAHDVYHDDSKMPSDEEKCANWLAEKMSAVSFPDTDIAIAQTAILGTTAHIGEDGTIVQLARSMAYESVRAGEIAICVADADLEALFASHGPAVAHDYFKETLGIPTAETPQSLKGIIAFTRLQIELLQNHKYLDPDLELLLGNQRQANIGHHLMLLAGLETGTISSWGEIVEIDNQLIHEQS